MSFKNWRSEMKEMENFAFAELRKVIWEENCKDLVYPLLMDEFNIGIEEAKEITDSAFQKWENAYYPD